MRSIVLVLCLVFVFVSCSTKKVSSERSEYLKLVSELKEMVSRYEKRTEVYKDSLLMVKGLVEKSSNVADSVSHLETSYATSDAAIRNGRLFHSIENKDSVPGQVKYVFIEVEKRDTVFVGRKDTVYLQRMERTETVKEKKRLGETFFYISGWVAWVLAVVGCGIWFRYKIKKGER